MASSPPTHPSFLPTPPTSPARWPVATSRPTPCRPPSPISRPVPPPPRSACNSTTRWPPSASRSPASLPPAAKPTSVSPPPTRPLRSVANSRDHRSPSSPSPAPPKAAGSPMRLSSSPPRVPRPILPLPTKMTPRSSMRSHLPSPLTCRRPLRTQRNPLGRYPRSHGQCHARPMGHPRVALFHLLPRRAHRHRRHKLWRHSL